METFFLKIFRGNPKEQYFEIFELKRVPYLNVIAALMEIQKNPINKEGKLVDPITWEQGCLEEVCGSCSMLINGKPRQACTALIETLLQESEERTITIAPLTKFPLVRDLVVDRSIMFENLKKVHAWIDTDGSKAKEEAPPIFPEKQEVMYSLSQCMTCGCCVEACPQSNPKTSFLGPQIFAQVRFFNDHPVGHTQKKERLDPLMEKGGIMTCGNAQNCQKVCPKEIPLLESIAEMGRAVNEQAFQEIWGLNDDAK